MMKSVVLLCITSLFILTSCALAGSDFLKDLVLYHPYDEGQGSIAGDASGQGAQSEGHRYDGVISNPTWVDGRFGRALQFGGEGSGTFVNVADHPKLNLDACSFMAWIKADHWIGTRQIVGKSVHAGCSGSAQYGLFSEDGVLKLRFETQEGSVDITTDLPPLNSFVHVAFTNDGNVGRLYIDGVLASAAATGSQLITNNDPWQVGQDCGHADYIFAGVIDEVRLWSRALSASEIGDYMKKGVLLLYAARNVTKSTQVWGEVKENR